MTVLKPFAIYIGLALCATAHAGSFTGPQSSQTPYIVPTADGWDVTALLSVGDMAKLSSYPMVGIPDGMGAIAGQIASNGEHIADKSHMTIFLNHEIRPSAGTVRAHGQTGAFVSAWTLHLNSLQVKRGEDLIRRVYTWPNGGLSDSTGATVFNRFCSADLPTLSAFYNRQSGLGFNGLLFMNGEEAGNEGRAFAHIVSGADAGTSYELPYLGKFSWENSLAHPNAGNRTVVIGLDDSTPGQVYVYVGDKQNYGNPVERAGLMNGKLYGIAVTDGGPNYGNGVVTLESRGALQGRFTLRDLSAHATGTGAQLQSQSVAAGVTEFARPEDGHWDTRNPNVFYWATTGATLGGNPQSARLYKLTFDSITAPTGGTIELVIDSASLVGSDGATARSFDNITVDGDGNVLVQEDPGNSAYVAKIWKINPVTKTGEQIFESDRNRFVAGGSAYLTQDEENSGIIEVTDIVKNANWYEAGRRYYLGNMQAHYPNTSELVEGGQMYLIASPKRAASNVKRQ